jgi:AcrR family transcriptional regulator
MDAVHNQSEPQMPVIAAPQVARRSQPARGSYRHGDLRRALLDAGIELARDGGPDAVVLREATRRAGVVPNAAYRHFDSRDALLEAVRAAALAAMAVAMEEEIAVAERRARGPVELARARLRAVGTAYLRFARAQPGLFRTAFSPVAAGGGTAPAPASDRAGDSGLNPFELLGSALDSLTEAGVLSVDHRPAAEYLAWSAVHGMALLAIDGPLRQLSDEQAQALGQRLLDMVERGLV